MLAGFQHALLPCRLSSGARRALTCSSWPVLRLAASPLPCHAFAGALAEPQISPHAPHVGWMLARWSWTVPSTWASGYPSPSASSA